MDIPVAALRVRGVLAAHFRVDGASATRVVYDNKTARVTGKADSLLPLYAAQLNIYGDILETVTGDPVTELALVYHEAGENAVDVRDDGSYAVPFTPVVHPVQRYHGTARALALRYRELMSGPFPGLDAVKSKELVALCNIIKETL